MESSIEFVYENTDCHILHCGSFFIILCDFLLMWRLSRWLIVHASTLCWEGKYMLEVDLRCYKVCGQIFDH